MKNPESLYEVSKRDASQLFIRALATGELPPDLASYAASFAVTGELAPDMDLRAYCKHNSISRSARFLLSRMKLLESDRRLFGYRSAFKFRVATVREALKAMRTSLKKYEELRDIRSPAP